jgi:hypothetical protein
MRRLGADARRGHVPPERLIVLFKSTWRAHTVHRTLSRDEAERLLDHMITMCIEEYYRAD